MMVVERTDFRLCHPDRSEGSMGLTVRSQGSFVTLWTTAAGIFYRQIVKITAAP